MDKTDVCKADCADDASVASAATAAPTSAASLTATGVASSDAFSSDEANAMFEQFIRDTDPELLAVVDPAPPEEGDTAAPLSDGIKTAIENYEAASGKLLANNEIISCKEGVVYWATLKMKMGSKDKGGFHQKFLRALEWDEAAKDCWAHVPDNERQAFKANWATYNNFQFCIIQKRHFNSYQKGSKTVGEMLTIYAIARELGGWDHKECRHGAFRYA